MRFGRYLVRTHCNKSPCEHRADVKDKRSCPLIITIRVPGRFALLRDGKQDENARMDAFVFSDRRPLSTSRRPESRKSFHRLVVMFDTSIEQI